MGSLAAVIDLSIVIPAYNEAQRLRPTLDRVHAFLTAFAAGTALTWEILVVDDGSQDGTADLVDRTATEIPHLRCVRQMPNRGKGAAVRVGMRAARGRIRVMCDADCSMPPEELPKLLARVSDACPIAIGSRYADGAAVAQKQPLYRRVWSRLANKVIQRSLVPGIRDTRCGVPLERTKRGGQRVVERAQTGTDRPHRAPRVSEPPRLDRARPGKTLGDEPLTVIVLTLLDHERYSTEVLRHPNLALWGALGP